MTKKTPPVLTQEEIDKLVAQLGAKEFDNDRLAALLHERDTIIGASEPLAALADAQATINAKDAEITTLRQAADELSAKLADCVEKLNSAQDPVHGIEHPRKVEDLPSLNDLPPHKPID